MTLTLATVGTQTTLELAVVETLTTGSFGASAPTAGQVTQVVDAGVRTLAVGVLRGLYLGLLTGVIPATIAWAMGFLFKYVTNVSIPAFGVVVLAVALAGANGGLLAVIDPAIQQSADAPTLVTALLVVMMLALYAHGRGDALGAALPRRFGLDRLGSATLSREVVDLVGSRGQVTVRVVGAVEDVPGYPPLPAELRAEIAAWEVSLPADLPLVELETRVADRLRTTFDLAEVRVDVDDRAAATVAAAPPSSGVSRRVGTGRRAPSISTLLPTGLARGDEVTVATGDDTVRGTVVSAGSYADGVPFGRGLDDVRADRGLGGVGHSVSTATGPAATGGSTAGSAAAGGRPADTVSTAQPTGSVAAEAPTDTGESRRTGTTVGGPGRLTVAVGGDDVDRLLSVSAADTVVRPRGDGRGYEVLSRLRRSGLRLRRLQLRAESRLVGARIDDLATDETTPVVVLAIRESGDWTFAPDGDRRLTAGEDVFLLATRRAWTDLSRGAS
ncbi:potassium transporter TrkA [Halobaculum sp. MBLA0147]|uniref:potassium transporter TrkA n=1 Tax=Halobaculum sp. MBLA0147 TaxID=3079934 RepID=UPI0035244571